VYLRFRLSKFFLYTSSVPSDDREELARQWRLEALDVLKSSTGFGEVARAKRFRRVTLLESPEVGARALHAALLFHNGEPDHARQVAAALIDQLDRSCRQLSTSECDVLYGRAGALQAVLWLRSELREPMLGSDLAMRLAAEIVAEGREYALEHSEAGLPLLWVWHESWYLGAAHGISGILQSLLALDSSDLQRLDRQLGGKVHDDIQATIDMLQEHCFASGTLDSSIHIPARKSRSDRLVQWCHGAPGHVLLLLQAHRVYGHDDYLQRATHIANNVMWPQGLLRKGVGLCHGIAGNAYSLLELGRYDTQFVRKAEYFAEFALDHLPELESVPDRPYSLYEGLAGLGVLVLDLLSSPLDARFPLYC
jgi:Lanthionine synthetase C-like protein